MADKAAAERACKDPNPIIDGRKANVNLAYLGAKPRGNLQAGEWGQYACLSVPLVFLFPFLSTNRYAHVKGLISWWRAKC